MMGISKRYDVADAWTQGFCDGIRPSCILPSASEHYVAGYEAGYGLRKQKNDLLNEYMVKVGMVPFGVVRLAAEAGRK